MKIPYTPPGVFFGQNPGREQFLVVIFPARRQKKNPWWCIRFLLPAALSPGWNHGWADRRRVGGQAYGSVLKREATHCGFGRADVDVLLLT